MASMRSAVTKTKGLGVILFTPWSLRLADNEALYMAHHNHSKVLHMFVIDPEWSEGETYVGKFPRMSAMKKQFLYESLVSLRNGVKARGSSFLVRRGDTSVVVADVVAEIGATDVYMMDEVGTEEENRILRLERKLSESGVKLRRFWGGKTLYEKDELPFDDLPNMYTTFRKKVEGKCSIRDPLPVPPIWASDVDISKDSEEVMECLHTGVSSPLFCGGEEKAWDRLVDWIWRKEGIKTYKDTRNGMLNFDDSSKFSPYLALGCISPRQIAAEIKKYEAKCGSSVHTYWVLFELLWRDYFVHYAAKYGRKLFLRTGPRDVSKPWTRDDRLLRAWIEGKTGYPFVDACMVELATTGFMSNRGRQNVASFLINDLGLDWRLGAAYFESVLLDFDVGSNYGNWTYLAGVGADPRSHRYFSIPKQAKQYDAAPFIRHHLPHLAHLRDHELFNAPGKSKYLEPICPLLHAPKPSTSVVPPSKEHSPSTPSKSTAAAAQGGGGRNRRGRGGRLKKYTN